MTPRSGRQTDYLRAIEPLSDFNRSLGEVPVRLNAFHAQSVEGGRSAGAQEVESLAQTLNDRGINAIILPALYL